MGDVEHELRLLWAAVLNGLLGWAAFRATLTWNDGDRVQRWLDTLLLWWVGQYLIIGGLGLVGWLSLPEVSIITILGSIAVVILTRSKVMRLPEPVEGKRGQFALQLGFALVVCEVAALVWRLGVLPPVSDDALTYHLPAAATWLREGRICIYETWFFNPANTYSPLGGSLFAAWLIVPFQSDVAARFMQVPAVLVVYLASVQLGRRLGAGMTVAVLLGLATAMGAPVVRQTALAKDDLFLAAFVLVLINGIQRTDRFAPWRIGLAAGMAAAIKVTSVYALAPILLLLIPIKRPDWRRLAIVVLSAAVIAAPWYLRNLMLFGNPLFPTEVRLLGMTVFPGLFTTTNSPRLREWDGLAEVFITGYFSFGLAMAAIAGLALFVAAVCSFRRWVHEPIVRVCVIGPLIGTAAFLLTAPYAEVRFLYPWFFTAILSIALWPSAVRVPMAAITLVVSVMTSFASDLLIDLLPLVAGAFVLVQVLRLLLLASRRVRIATLIALSLTGAAAIWVNWRSYVESLPAMADLAWEEKYPHLGKAWSFIRNSTPPDAVVAYTGTYLTYPLMGRDLRREVLHVPVSSTVTSLDRLPKFDAPMSARNMLRTVIPAGEVNADQSLWLRRIDEAGVSYLLINLQPPANAPTPVEWRWVQRDRRFERVFWSGNVAVFAVRTAWQVAPPTGTE